MGIHRTTGLDAQSNPCEVVREDRAIRDSSGLSRPIVRTTRPCPISGAMGHTFIEAGSCKALPAGFDAMSWQTQRAFLATPPESWPATAAQQFQTIVEPMRLSGRTSVRTQDADPLEPEIERMRAAGFVAAADMLRAAHPVKNRVIDETAEFDFGVPRIAMNLNSIPGARAQVDALLARHAHGDHGAFGDSTTVKLTEDQKFAPMLFGQLVVNAAAIDSGYGVVQSRYSMFTPEVAAQARAFGLTYGVPAGAPQGRDALPKEGDEVAIVSLLIPGQPTETMVFAHGYQQYG
jgi:hypothetical protein